MPKATEKPVSAKTLTLLAMLTAAAAAVGFAESLLPPLIPALPGAKLGLGNIFSLFALVNLGAPAAFAIVIVRCLLSAALWGSPMSLIYALAGGLLSMGIMCLGRRLLGDKLSLYGLSALGALFHNTGQVTVAAIIMNSALMFGYLPLLLVAAVPTGLFVGFVTSLLTRIYGRAGRW